METASYRILWQTWVRRAEKVLRTACVNSLRLTDERALDVGSLSRGTGTFQVRKPKVPEGCVDVIVRENSDELTLRAEEVGTSKALVNVNHIEQERWEPPPWLMLTGMPSAKR